MSAVDSGGERGVKLYTFIMTDGFEPDGRVYEVQPKEPHKHAHPPERMVAATSYDALAAERDRLVEALREIETICTESSRVGNLLVTVLAALSGGRHG